MALKGFSRWLNVHGRARTDPGARFRTPRLKRVVPVLPPFAELEATLTAEPSARNRAIIAMALYGGLRAEEIRNIKRGSFVADQGLIGFVGKGSKQRSVALPPQALKLITAYLASNDKLVKPSDPLIRKEDGSGDGLSYHVINRAVTRWTKRHLGVRLTPHKLRHATVDSASTSAWTSASSPKPSATSRWSRPRSTRRCPSSGPGESPSYFAPPGSEIIRAKTASNINHFPQV